MAIAHKSPTSNRCALEQLSRCLQTTSVFETLFTFRHPYKCAPPNSSSLLLCIIKSLGLSERRYQASEAHYQISPTRTLARPFHTKPDPTMPPFYPYTPVPTKHNTTLPCTHTPTLTVFSAQALQTTSIAEQNSTGTSLSTADIIGIIAGVLILFLGLAWFAYHALAVMPARKKAVLRERKRGRKRGDVV
jgi:hypothetical protein